MKAIKVIKKMVALGIGLTMVGATLMGAGAASGVSIADAVNGPTYFAAGGVAEDNLAMTEIANGLNKVKQQYAAGASPMQMGPADRAMVDVEDELNYGEVMTQTFDDGDLWALADGNLDETEGDNSNDVDYQQFLVVDPDGVLSVAYQTDTEDNDDNAVLALNIDDGVAVFSYELQFDNGVTISDTSPSDDMTAVELSILPRRSNLVASALPTTHIVSDVELNAGTTAIREIELLGGAIQDILEERESKTYTLDGISYEVEARIITETQVKFVVNGALTDALAVGDDAPVAGTRIGASEILENEGSEEFGGDIVEFFLGSNTLLLDHNSEAELNGQDVDNSLVTIDSSDNGANVDLNGFTIEIAHDGDDLFLDAEDASLVSSTGTNVFHDPFGFGLFLENSGPHIDPQVNAGDFRGSATSGDFDFMNNRGEEINFDLLEVSSAAEMGRWNTFLFDGEVVDVSGGDPADPSQLLIGADMSGPSGLNVQLFDMMITGVGGATTEVTLESDQTGSEATVTLDTSGADAYGDTGTLGPLDVTVHWDAGGDGACSAGSGDSICVVGLEGTPLVEWATGGAIGNGEGIRSENGGTWAFDRSSPIAGDLSIGFVPDDELIGATPTNRVDIDYVSSELQALEPAGSVAEDDDSNWKRGYGTWFETWRWNSETGTWELSSPDDQGVVNVYVGVGASLAGPSGTGMLGNFDVAGTRLPGELLMPLGRTALIGGGCVWLQASSSVQDHLVEQFGDAASCENWPFNPGEAAVLTSKDGKKTMWAGSEASATRGLGGQVNSDAGSIVGMSNVVVRNVDTSNPTISSISTPAGSGDLV